MKLFKFLTASALTLALSGASIVPALAEEPVNTENTEVIPGQDEYTGADTWKYSRALAASYLGVSFSGGGEYHNSFYVGATSEQYGVRFNFKNNGINTFDWKIFAPDGSVWRNGTLTPGQSVTPEYEKDCYQMKIGTYKFSIITKNGGNGAFDFAFRILD